MAAPPLSPSTASVHILDISCVKPLHGTKRFNLYLPCTDEFFQDLPYIRALLFYSLDGASSACDMDALKHGLSLALVPFYPVAGRIHHIDGTTSIDCNDDGAQFVEAVSDCDFAQLEERSFPIHDFYAQLASNFPPRLHDAPLLSIQVTRFQDGRGIAVGVAASHVVFDAHALWYFLTSWAQCCRGQGISLPPLHIRALMSPDFWRSDKLAKKTSASNDFHLPPRSLPLPPKTYHTVMHFDSATARRLKKSAVQESENVHISTFQAVMACVWKRLASAQDLPDHHKIVLCIPVDVRHKVIPSLTAAYFGNALLTTHACAIVGDLRRESIGAIAAKIKESLNAFDDQLYLKERLATSHERFIDEINEICTSNDQYLFVSNGPRLPVYNVDVGMGKLLAVRPAPMPVVDTPCVYPGREEGSIQVSLAFSTLQSLEAFLSITCPSLDI